MPQIRPRRLVFALMLAPVLMASKCRKDKDKVDDGDLDIEPAAPTATLRVTGVEPDEVQPGQLTRGVIYGSGFESGVQVRVDDSPVASVTFQDSKVLKVTLPPLQSGSHDLRVRNPDGTTATLRNAILARGSQTDKLALLRCGDITVYFDFDSDALTSSSRSELTDKMPCFQQRDGEVRIEGHTDERGTTDYNLALGQRRADAVRSWLLGQGVTARRIRTVSYGEEQPAEQGSTETAWGKNRRAKIAVSR